MINHITPRSNKSLIDAPAIFLAGSIDMGSAEDWQAVMIERLGSDNLLLNVYNPRRPGFHEFDDVEQHYQINWELDALHEKDIPLKAAFFNFTATSKAPVTMLELGICLPKYKQNNIIVCPKEFYRYDNVKLTADRYQVKVYHDIEEGYSEFLKIIGEQ